MKTTRFLCSFGMACVLGLAVAGCDTPERKQPDFHTSGSREADQRAEQQVAKVQQLRGEGVGDDKKKKGLEGLISGQTAPKKSLFERLGGEPGVGTIVEDWVNRMIADPRVNFTRKGITKGGFSIHRNESVEWQNVPEKGTLLKKHFAEFLTLSTGGPPQYSGKEMKAAHADMHISNDEFDAAMGDLKSSLDNLGVPTTEQKELLAIVESTRPQVATKR
jgi:hemoglobin